MSGVVEQIQLYRAQLERAGQVYVGYSGGVDSHVLLHAVVSVLGGDNVVAVHVNHQLSERAGMWAEHCTSVCRELGVNVRVQAVDVSRLAASRENAARESRYGVFEQILGEDDILLLAHHLDDQAETVLYRLLRSSGPRGLSGIPLSRAVGLGSLLRPLLNVSRSDLCEYAQAHQLEWIEDPSNVDLLHDRNYLRHQVTPALGRRWPDFAARIAASASLCAESDRLNDDLAGIDLSGLLLRRERLGWSVELAGLSALSPLRQANLLRYWSGLHCARPPGYRTVMEVLSSLLSARDDAAPLVRWQGGEWRRFRGRLFLLPGGLGVDFGGGEALAALAWKPLESPLALPDGSYLSAVPSRERGLKLLPGEQLRIGFRQGGERCRPAGRGGSNSLKKLFQEYQLEPWLRDRVPLVYRGEQNAELIAVGDLWVCQGFEQCGAESIYALQWQQGGAVHTA